MATKRASYSKVLMKTYIFGISTTNIIADSAKAAAKIIAKDMISFYKGNDPGQTPGTLLKPYYWWQAGAMWGELIEYWSMTGDTQYNSLVTNSLLYQVGNDRNFMPANASNEEGNDDQVCNKFQGSFRRV